MLERTDRREIAVTGSSQKPPPNPQKFQCDFVFVTDTTGSMNDKIEGLLSTCQKFTDRVATANIDWQIAVVAFGDLLVPNDKIVATAFSNKTEVVKRSFMNIPRYSGGANHGESSYEALEYALNLNGFRPEALKIFILVTDEPPHQDRLTTQGIIGKLKQANVITFVVSIPSPLLSAISDLTGGKWYPISSHADFLTILDFLTKQVVTTTLAVFQEAGGDVGRYLQKYKGE